MTSLSQLLFRLLCMMWWCRSGWGGDVNCTTGVYTGRNGAFVTCIFNENLKTSRRNINVIRYAANDVAMEHAREILACNWQENRGRTELECRADNGYLFNNTATSRRDVVDTATLAVPYVSAAMSGTYACQLVPDINDKVHTCFLHVLDTAIKDSDEALVQYEDGNRDNDLNVKDSTTYGPAILAITIVVLIGTMIIIIIGVIVIKNNYAVRCQKSRNSCFGVQIIPRSLPVINAECTRTHMRDREQNQEIDYRDQQPLLEPRRAKTTTPNPIYKFEAAGASQGSSTEPTSSHEIPSEDDGEAVGHQTKILTTGDARDPKSQDKGKSDIPKKSSDENLRTASTATVAPTQTPTTTAFTHNAPTTMATTAETTSTPTVTASTSNDKGSEPKPSQSSFTKVKEDTESLSEKLDLSRSRSSLSNIVQEASTEETQQKDGLLTMIPIPPP